MAEAFGARRITIENQIPDSLPLMRVDKMSMGVSLEGRVPFLDHKLVELALGIPSALKTKNGQLKYILKKAVRGVIPDEIIDRKKQGFGVFISPHYLYPADQAWQFGGAVEQMMLEGKEFWRPDPLSLDGFPGSGADWAAAQAPRGAHARRRVPALPEGRNRREPPAAGRCTWSARFR